MSAMLFA